MSVTLKMEKHEVATDLGDSIWPTERADGRTAFALWIAGLLLSIILLSRFDATRDIALLIAVWWAMSAFVMMVVVPFLKVRRLRALGETHVVNNRHFARLKTVLSKGAARLGTGEPSAFVVDPNRRALRICSARRPHALAISESAAAELGQSELDCLLIQSLIHLRQGHGARLLLLQSLDEMSIPLRIAAWPMSFYGTLLRSRWHDSALKSADRLALLLFRNQKLLLSAFLKEHFAANAIAQSNPISPADVDRFVQQEGVIGLESDEISTQYKVGSAIRANPILKDRVDALYAWSKSPEYQEALQKLVASSAPAKPA